MTRLTRISILLAVFFALDKGLAILRQVVIGRLFGLSAELDAFNVANNLPDLLFVLISGGALAVAFIPILSDVLTHEGRKPSWKLFSRIANLAFLVTAAMAVILALIADHLVGWELGIAPGFGQEQQKLVIELLRLNLVATIIFSLSGLVMAGLQANQHFLLPAMAPILYNIGQIFGALVLSPQKGIALGPITLPAFGLGVHGLVYGVILGAFLHLAVQIPALIKYQFHWSASIGLGDEQVKRVLRLMVPRLATVFLVQLIFIVRDNLASRLPEGAVTALSFGWMIMQVPETLIGTAIGTALLPTLSEYIARQEWDAFQATIERAIRVLIAFTLPVSAILALGLRPLLESVFGFNAAGTDLLLWVTRGYLAGLAGQCLLEVAARAFYARKDALTPLLAAGVNLAMYIVVGIFLFQSMGAPGISLTDSIAFTIQSLLLLILLNRHLDKKFSVQSSIWRAGVAALAGGIVVYTVLFLAPIQISPPMVGLAGLALGALAALPFVLREVKLLLRL